jgi:hypothetical protein
MAQVDVTELLDDADFIDWFNVTRSQQVIDRHGRAAAGTTSKPKIWGVVQPVSGRTMRRLPDSVIVDGAIEIWSRFRLEGPSDTTQADLITWKGKQYRVATVIDWTNYGQGFVHVVCELTDLLPSAPTRNVTSSDP